MQEGPTEASPSRNPDVARVLDGPHVHCLRTLVACLGLVLHARALGERAVAVGFDAAVVNEEVLAAFIGRDEAKALLVTEPLDHSCCHVFPPRRSSCCVCRGSSRQPSASACTAFAGRLSPGPTCAHGTTAGGRALGDFA